MLYRCIAAVAVVAALAGCAANPGAQHVWNGGTWNSVLGYHGPDNAIVANGSR